MKLLKYLKNKELIFLAVVVFLALLVRFYNFPNRVTFWTEQAQTLMTSAQYLSKPSLLGQEFFRTDSRGHIIFAGALFNYLLVPGYLLTKGDPISITAFFALLNVFTGIVTYFVVKRIFNKIIAGLAATVFLFSFPMIYHSLFIWIYNPMPLIGILIFYFLFKRDLFWIGFLSGVGISFQILFAPFAFIALVIGIFRSKRKITGFIYFLLGAVLGNLPMVLFDLRHNFYETRTIFQYLIDTLQGKSDAAFNFYYFLAIIPILATMGGYGLYFVWRKSRIFTVLVLLTYVFLNLQSKMIDWQRPTGANGLKVNEVESAAKSIAEDAKSEFNVAEVLDFDKRAYVLRYFLQYKFGKVPMGVEDYPNSKTLYVLSAKNFDFARTNIWEVKSGGPYKVSKFSDVGVDYQISKLVHCQSCK